MESLTLNKKEMAEIHFIKGSINVNANAKEVWAVLTEPDKVKAYLGSAAKTDWKQGSDISWETEQAGTAYQDKGRVLENEANKTLKYTYWSSLAGTEENEENASIISWSLENSMEGLTTLTYLRENIPTLEERAILEEQLPSMLDEIKRLAEE